LFISLLNKLENFNIYNNNVLALTALAGSQLRAGNHPNHNVSGEKYDKKFKSNIETITINVSNDLIGCIIGIRGSKIAEIR